MPTEAKKDFIPKPVFDSVKAFSEDVRAQTPKTAEGKNEYYLSETKKSEYDRKDGSHVVEYNVSLRNHNQEEIRFALTANGVMKNATYLDWSSGKPERTFLAKDIDKLDEVARSADLKEMAGLFNWDKAPAKEAEAEEVEME